MFGHLGVEVEDRFNEVEAEKVGKSTEFCNENNGSVWEFDGLGFFCLASLKSSYEEPEWERNLVVQLSTSMFSEANCWRAVLV